MDTVLASGGYPCTVILADKRDTYMAALEEASVNLNIVPFCELLGQMVKEADQQKLMGGTS